MAMKVAGPVPPGTEITIRKPYDFHLHARKDNLIRYALGTMPDHFAGALLMPNLKPHIYTGPQAIEYCDRVTAVLPEWSTFKVMVTIYLTEETTPEMIYEAHRLGVTAAKLYLAGATTNSAEGVKDIKKVHPALKAMQEVGMPLCVHGEVVDQNVDVFDLEAEFIERELRPLATLFPYLRIVFEHITTEEAVKFVMETPNVFATITAHHLLYNRNALLMGGIRPHHFCFPILKRERHREALVAAATSGSKKFFLGSDSAPHAQGSKECACGCGGCYTAHATIELYAEVFDEAGTLDKLEGFASTNGAEFYSIEPSEKRIALIKKPWKVLPSYSFGESVVIPIRAGEMVQWKVKKN